MSNKNYNRDGSGKLYFANVLCKNLLKVLKDEGTVLKEENRQITQDSASSIEHDYEYVKIYLKDYIRNNRKIFNFKLKPKGKILIILPYNEPFILSIVPILNALVAGNTTKIKPSKKCTIFFKNIWLNLIKKLKLPVEIINKPDGSVIKAIITNVDCVYFFGSHENAIKIYKTCAESFVEFIPEIETADCKVIKFNKSKDLSRDCRDTLIQAYSHAGQTCQRISGIFIHEDNFEKYKKNIESEFNKLIKEGIEGLIPKDYIVNDTYQKKILSDIHNANPSKIIESADCIPKIVIKPDMLSDFVNNGYFYPVVWLTSFKSIEELCRYLNKRKFYLGLNIQSNDNIFIDSLIQKTQFARYTLNTKHTNISSGEGWGGRWPSGAGGYKNWIEHFSVSFEIINN